MEEKIFTNQNRYEASALKSYSKQHLADAMDQLNTFQQSTSEDVVTAWWDFFWDVLVSKYRDIYKYDRPTSLLLSSSSHGLCRVTRPNAENFLYAPDFMGYDRWWSEMVGYWGKPGQASPGRESMGVPPLVFETTKTREEFHEKYPSGEQTRHFLHPTFTAEEVPVVPIIPSPPVPVLPPAAVDVDSPVSPPSSETTTTNPVVKYGGGGYLLGILSTVLFMTLWKRLNPKAGYDRIPDSDIRI
jgi:hypothetical protein